MSGQPQFHPEADTLRAFSLGMLDPPEAIEVEQHVVACPQCCETLLSLGEDTFVDLVRRSERAGPRLPGGEETIDSLIESSGGEAALPAALADHPRYRIVRLVGRGGMGDVYQAQHTLMNRPVAIKVISRRLVANPAAVDRFHREVQAAARLSHPNIVTAHDAEQAGDVHFLVMEYVEGVDLAEVVKERGPLPLARACDYVRQAAAGLQHAHEQGMVHRDIKPHNLMLTGDRRIKILDFGLANFASESAAAEMNFAGEREPTDAAASQLTTLGTTMGTPDYIAPEQAEDAHAADIRADIYSLGCTLYFLLAGKPPFAEGDVMQKLAAHRSQAPEPIQDIRVDVPRELADVIRRMMAKNPAERLQTPAEVADALAPFVDRQRSFPAKEPKPGADTGQRSRNPARMIGMVAAAACLCAAVLGAVIYVATDNGTLAIESEDDDVEIMIARPRSDTDKGLEVRIVDRVTGSQVVRLRSGHYRLLLQGQGNEYTLTKEQFVLRRGGKVVVKVVRRPGAAGDVARAGKFTEVRRFGDLHTRMLADVAFVPSAEGRHVATASNDGTVRIWDVDTGKEARPFLNHDEAILSIAASPDGKTIAAGGRTGTVYLWDVENRKVRQSLAAGPGYVYDLAFSHDGERLYVGIAHYAEKVSGSVVVFDAASGERLREFEGVERAVHTVAPLRLDGRVLAGGEFRAAGVWDAETGRLLTHFLDLPTHAKALAPSPDGTLTAIGFSVTKLRDQRFDDSDAPGIWLCDTKTGRLVRKLRGHTGNVNDVVWTQDGRFLISGSGGRHNNDGFFPAWDNTLRVWDAQTGAEMASARIETGVRSLILLPDDRHVVTAGGDNGKPDLRLWRLPESVWPVETHEFTALGPFTGHGGRVNRAVFLPDGRRVVSCGADKTVRIWNVATRKEKQRLEGHDAEVIALAVTSDGRRLASGDKAGSVRLWDLETGMDLGELPGNEDAVLALAFLPDGTHLLSASFDKKLRLWDIDGRTLERTIEVGVRANEMEALPDGKHIVFSGADVAGWGVEFYDLEKGARLEERASILSCFDVSPDGSRTLIGYINGLIKLLDTQSRNVVIQVTDPKGDAVMRAALSPDARFAVTTTRDNWMHLWDLTKGRLLTSIESEAIGLLSLSSDGRFAVTIGHGGGPQVWRLPKSAWPQPKLQDASAAPPAAVAPFDAAAAQQLQDTWAAHLGVPVEYTNSLGIRFRLIPPGEFEMGSADEVLAQLQPQDDWFFSGWINERRRGEMPRHRVRITKPFYLAAHEVTRVQFRQFVEAKSYRTAAEIVRNGGPGYAGGEWQQGKEYNWRNPGFPQGDDHPVCNLDWSDAAAFCRWLSEQEKGECRLPTEAEWEYACRAGTIALFSSGDDVKSLQTVANLADRSLAEAAPRVKWAADWDDGHPYTAPIGQRQPNAFGLFDMHGNASEWCSDWYGTGYYGQSPADDPVGPASGDVHVFRGGAFDNWAGFARSADRRSSHSPTIRTDWAGFRVVLSVEGVQTKSAKAVSTSKESPNQE